MVSANKLSIEGSRLAPTPWPLQSRSSSVSQSASGSGTSVFKSMAKKIAKGLKEHHEKTEAAFDALYGRRSAVYGAEREVR